MPVGFTEKPKAVTIMLRFWDCIRGSHANHQTTGYAAFGRKFPRIFKLCYLRETLLNLLGGMPDGFHNFTVDRIELFNDPLLEL